MTRWLRKGLVLSGVLSAVALCGGIAEAAWPNGTGFWSDFKGSWCRNNAWPDPYLLPDRVSVPNTLSIFVDRGWQRQCLLGDYHFDENGKLSSAGQARVRQILTQAPPDRRAIFIERTGADETTRARIDVVQQYVAGAVTDGPLPPVTPSNLQSEGWPAEYVDSVNRRYQASMPDPRISSGGGSGSTSSSSNGP
ncbi:MAG: hypothetical protein QM811_18400 [Pirellulales bacterium]